MRITRSMMNDQVQWNISRILRDFGKLQNQMSSGKKVEYPSDDPVVALRASDMASKLRQFEQYRRNAEMANNYLGSFDSAVQEYISLLHRVKELVVKGASGTLSDADRMAIVTELREIQEHIVTIANTQVAGRYIFSGTSSDVPPVTKDENGRYVLGLPLGTKNLDTVVLGQCVEYTLTADEVFVTQSGESIFKAIDRIVEHLEDEETAGVLLNSADIASVDRALERALEATAKIGGTTRLLEYLGNRLDDLQLYSIEVLSKEQDVDIAEVVSKLATKQAALQAALKSAAQVLQPTLLDFLR
ncbi:MAG: flagellar hook-associated protein FlgL [Thermotogae bacterium]|nr:flagellar hook-associated protein FlgL [Thermotogota bacterium]